MPDLPTFPITSLHVLPLPDPVVEAVGHDPRSPYVEQFWLGVLGPTATWLLRRLVTRLDTEPEGYVLALPEVAAELGLGQRSGRHSPFLRTLDRCERFGVIERNGGTVRVRRKLPPLTRYQLERLPEHLQRAHREWQDEEVARPAAGLHERRESLRGMALSLLEQGMDGERAEQRLHEHDAHPALASEAVAWAIAHRGVSRSIADRDLPPEAA